jgi:hypothetical protein
MIVAKLQYNQIILSSLLKPCGHFKVERLHVMLFGDVCHMIPVARELERKLAVSRFFGTIGPAFTNVSCSYCKSLSIGLISHQFSLVSFDF